MEKITVMTKQSIITLGRFVTFSIIFMAITSCGNSEDVMVQGNYGPSLYFAHRPPEQIIIKDDHYLPISADLFCADLHLFVTSEFRKEFAGSSLVPYRIEGDEWIEQQIRDYLDPTGEKYNGSMPIFIEYTTEGCKRIRITIHDKDEKLLSDITDQACFYYVGYTDEGKELNLLINTSKKLLGNIPIGMTIQEYLAQKPMVFTEARFIFPGVEKDALENGNYLRVEIELDGGKIITADQRQYWYNAG